MENSNLSNSKYSRPKLLTILCYLTMFGSSWSITQSFATLGNPEQVSIELGKNLQEMQVRFEETFKNDPKTLGQIDNLISDVAESNSSSHMRDNSIFSLISNILTLLGAMLMLRLRRNGFRFYVLGTLIGIISPLVVFGASNLLGVSFAIYLSFLGTIFIAMYAFKLKHMD